MPHRWLCISTRANNKITQQENIWGVAHQYEKTILKVKMGDILLMYTMRKLVNNEIMPSAVNGVYEVISDVYEDATSLFETPKGMGEEKFPLRVKVKPVKIFKEPIPFKPLVPRMSFIKNKKMWSGSIRRAMMMISEEDYQLILAAET